LKLKFRVEHLVTKLHGGAGIAARRLSSSMKEDVDSHVVTEDVVLRSFSTRKRIILYTKKLLYVFFTKLFNRKLPKTERHWEKFDYIDGFYTHKSSADIIHYHWVSDFLRIKSLKKNKSIKSVITLHDMGYLTGGCHYSWSCDKYQIGCFKCPQIENNFFDIAKLNFNKKLKLFNELQPLIIATSNYMYKIAKKSLILKQCEIRHIPLGVDLREFYPLEKTNVQEVLGIKSGGNRITIGFGADSVSNKRKGGQYLPGIIKDLIASGYEVNFVLFGGGNVTDFDSKNVNIFHYGKVNSPDFLRILYNSLDFFIGLSLYEAFGQTCLEAMCCGTPSVVFEGTGFTDFVKNGETGIVVKNKDNIAFEMLRMFEDKFKINRVRDNCLKLSIDYDIAKIKDMHLKLYRDLLRL
jgi:glycosyltransferase involved in cell wall biosynthesis